jgi:hypothetical protein
MNLVRIQLTNSNNFFNLCYTNFWSWSHVFVKVSRRFSKLKITFCICSPCSHQRKISCDWFFQQIISVFKFPYFFWLRCNFNLFSLRLIFYWKSSVLNYCSTSSWGVKSWYASSTRTNFFSKGTLRGQFQFYHSL